MLRGRILDRDFLSCPSDLEYVRCFVRFFIIIVIIIIFYLFLCRLNFFIINWANFDLKLIEVVLYFFLEMTYNWNNFFYLSFLAIVSYNIFLKFVMDFTAQFMFLK